MKILIAGGSGFIGQALVQHLLRQGNTCTVIGRSVAKIKNIFADKVRAISWQQLAVEGLHEIKTADLIINLTGAGIGDKRWTPSRKQEILASRINATEMLADLCALLRENSPPLFNASAIGIYGLQNSPVTGLPSPSDETTPIDFLRHTDFLSQIGRAWELATEPAKQAGVRVVNMRFAVVLGKHGGVLNKLKWPFLFFIGGPIGNGQQPFCWIALEDLINAIEFLIAHPEISGPVNFVAPQCVTQTEFATALGKALHRPSFIATPGFALKAVFGEMADELLLRGQHVKPKVLLEHGFQFRYPEIQHALNALFRKVFKTKS